MQSKRLTTTKKTRGARSPRDNPRIQTKAKLGKAEIKLFLETAQEILNVLKALTWALEGKSETLSFAQLMLMIHERFEYGRMGSTLDQVMRQLVNFLTGFIVGLKGAGFDDEKIMQELTAWAMHSSVDSQRREAPMQ